jgi:hypothetical protein
MGGSSFVASGTYYAAVFLYYLIPDVHISVIFREFMDLL